VGERLNKKNYKIMKLRFIVANAAVAASTFAAPAMATPQGQFPDVQPTNWAYQAILNLKERYGCAEGFPDGTFRPGQPATRAQMAALTNHCLTNITEFYSAADAALAAALRAEYGPRLTALEVAAERKALGVGNYAGLAFTGYSADGTFDTDDYNAGVTLTGRAKVYEWKNNVAVSLRPELSFMDNNQTALGGAMTLDFPVGRRALSDGSKVASWNVYGGVGVGGVIGAADGTYNMYGEDVDGYGVIGTEVSLSKNFVGFANVKLPFSDNSVDNYAPVGTIGAGFKF
jgi:hypothetical protein